MSTNNSYLQLIKEAIMGLKEHKKGSSQTSIKKYIESNHKIELVTSYFNQAFADGLALGVIEQIGARFKLTTAPAKLV